MHHTPVLQRFLAALAGLVVVLSSPFAEANSPASSLQRAAVCRVHNRLPHIANVGSGTLVDKTEDGREGLVLTCWHLFREGMGQVVVVFSDGRSHGARVVAVDQPADLAALVVANPRPEPVSVNLTLNSQSRLSACGYGHSGQFRCTSGAYVGESQTPGQTSFMVSGAVRSGDSGGGVFDDQDRLVGVVWGQADGVIYASYGQPLRNFLGRVLGRRQQFVVDCTNGLCPRSQTPPRAGPSSGPGPRTGRLASLDPRFNQLAAAIEKLRVEKQDRGDYLTAKDLKQLRSESTARHESLLERIRVIAAGGSPSVGAAVAGLLGLSGPTGWAVLAVGTIGGWLIGQRMRRKLRGARGRRRPFRTK
ncbi:MAG: serine protease [Pirellulales bacterium]|nr:serine protease [Pirellulales bacterium]